jgi:hypothetical protein
MKYEIGDKVRIRKDLAYNNEAKTVLEKNNYILTIRAERKEQQKLRGGYYMEEFAYMGWSESYIECLYVKPINPNELINSRFEILDL